MPHDLPWIGLLALLAVIGAFATGASLLQGFPWEALATLVAGLAAVIGAVFVGKRQMIIANGQNEILTRQADIASRQTDILAQQVELEALKLKSELFDRRFEIFEAAHAFLIAAYNGEDLEGHAASIAFARARDAGRFLLDDETVDQLEKASNHGWQYGALKRYLESRGEFEDRDEENDYQAIMAAQAQIGRDLTGLAAIFKQHLAIVDPASSPTPPNSRPSQD